MYEHLLTCYSQIIDRIPGRRHFAKFVCLDQIRNAAPELLDESGRKATPASDIYSFGMTALEIFTEELAFAHIPGGTNTRNIYRLMDTIASGKLPERPQGTLYVERDLDDRVWTLLMKCWSADPVKRPTIDGIIGELSIVC